MNILWITLESILPANSGGRLGVFKRLEQIAKTNDIYLFYPYDNEEEIISITELEKYCKEVHAYPRYSNKKNALLHLIEYPYTVASRKIPTMEKDIQSCIDNNSIDVINVDFPHMCANLLNIDTYGIPIVMNEHNLEFEVYQTIANSQENIIKKALYGIDSGRLKSYETRLFKQLHISALTFVSSQDLQKMDEYGISGNVPKYLIPVGADSVDLDRTKKAEGTHNIIFVGKMSYGPNIEACEWFVKNVFPKVLEKFLDAKFYIVGKDPVEKVRNLASENIIVTGAVPEVTPYYELADLVVLPLLNGGGVKVKLLEAVGYGMPVVSTTTGVEGTLYNDGKTMPVTDDSNKFAKNCIELLSNAQRRQDVADKAHKLFLMNYTWKSVGEKYNTLLQNIYSSTR